MDSTINTLSTSWGTSAVESDKSKSLDSLDSEDFMNLMLAQLQNQDPTEPLDSNEMMSQMAEFSTSSGIGDLNDTANGLVASLQSSQALQASSLVGREVLVPGSSGALAEGGDIEGIVHLPQSTSAMSVGVYDERGQLVRQLELGSQVSGDVRFVWDGKDASGNALPAGNYDIVADAKIDGETTALATSIYAGVESVSLDKSGASPTLNLAGLGSRSFADVLQVK